MTIINSFFQCFTMMSFITQTNQENGYTVLLANFFMALALALVNAKEFAVTYEKSLALSANLEKITKEVRALLDSIPQGVLTIMDQGRIAPDFILITLLDVTAEKLLERESEKPRQELILIQELIDVAPSKIRAASPARMRAHPGYRGRAECPSDPDALRRTVLDNCMIHLLRNAMDHGIECPTVRREKRKPEGGVISVQAHAVGDFLKVRLRDDGRGLAIKQLREKGLQLGTLQADSDLQDVAELIFSGGVSTARPLSDISGRGVGMNAVRTFLEQAGGTIRVDIGSPTDETAQFNDFALEITLPLARSA